jgi:probable HAF family extracellular repeat protein
MQQYRPFVPLLALLVAALPSRARHAPPSVVPAQRADSPRSPRQGSRTTGYTLQELGTLGGPEIWARAINTRGDAAGSSSDARGRRRAFVFRNDRLTLLAARRELFPTDAFAINAAGTVVGQFRTASHQHAMCYRNGVAEDLGTLGGHYSSALAVNRAGQIAGWAETRNLDAHAFLYSAGKMRDLGTLGGATSQAYGINDAGEVVGAAGTRDGEDHAFRYRAGRMEDLGTLPGGRSSQARAINELGAVVGSSIGADGVSRPFIYQDRRMREIVSPSGGAGEAYAINASGQVVGSRGVPSSDASHAFLYSDGVMWDLNALIPRSLGWELHQAVGINDAGQIVGTGVVRGRLRAFRLTPAAAPPTLYRTLPHGRRIDAIQ